MFGLMVGLGARGRGVDREEQASAIISLIILSLSAHREGSPAQSLLSV